MPFSERQWLVKWSHDVFILKLPVYEDSVAPNELK